jgi:hypothetical protein
MDATFHKEGHAIHARFQHAHASHALDRGAPIHLVQATLGHSSVATTSAYLHARPVDSSARFVTVPRFLPESGRSRLPLGPTRVMDVWTANQRQRRNLSTFTIDSDNNITALAGLPDADNLQSFSTAKELAKLSTEWPASRLVETWNSFAGVAPSSRHFELVRVKGKHRRQTRELKIASVNTLPLPAT